MGDAKGIDCRAVIEEMYTFLDGELTEPQRLVIAGHLDGCIDCHEVVDFHAELKLAIAERCTDEVPFHLRERISKMLGMPPPPPPFGEGPVPGIPTL